MILIPLKWLESTCHSPVGALIYSTILIHHIIIILMWMQRITSRLSVKILEYSRYWYKLFILINQLSKFIDYEIADDYLIYMKLIWSRESCLFLCGNTVISNSEDRQFYCKCMSVLSFCYWQELAIYPCRQSQELSNYEKYIWLIKSNISRKCVIFLRKEIFQQQI